METDIPAAVAHVAESHFAVRGLLASRLKQQWVDTDIIGSVTGKPTNRGKVSYWTWWTERFGDKFYDMGSLIRLAAGLETGFRDYLRRKMQLNNLNDLRLFLASDSRWKGAVFQRIQPWHVRDGVESLFQEKLGSDLKANSNLHGMQELMLHRHLYAHRGGVLDDQYIAGWQRLTTENLANDPAISPVYPAQDVYWFRPLNHLADYINAAQGFFRELP
jgi:hypothetical protein